MLNISRLFGKSPFSPLKLHIEKVRACVLKLKEIFDSHLVFDQKKLHEAVAELSKLEHAADLTKNDIRKQFPKSLFLAIDRTQLQEILSIQDDIADKAEEIGHLLVLKPLAPIDNLYDDLKGFFEKNLEAFNEAYLIMLEMDNLLEASFGGIEAKKVKAMIELTAYKEYESDLMKHQLMQAFFNKCGHLNVADFYLWTKLIEEIGKISHISESLSIRVRSLLEIN